MEDPATQKPEEFSRRLFMGEDKVRPLPAMTKEDPNCR
jgi:hypothetical protein